MPFFLLVGFPVSADFDSPIRNLSVPLDTCTAPMYLHCFSFIDPSKPIPPLPLYTHLLYSSPPYIYNCLYFVCNSSFQCCSSIRLPIRLFLQICFLFSPVLHIYSCCCKPSIQSVRSGCFPLTPSSAGIGRLAGPRLLGGRSSLLRSTHQLQYHQLKLARSWDS